MGPTLMHTLPEFEGTRPRAVPRGGPVGVNGLIWAAATSVGPFAPAAVQAMFNAPGPNHPQEGPIRVFP